MFVGQSFKYLMIFDFILQDLPAYKNYDGIIFEFGDFG